MDVCTSLATSGKEPDSFGALTRAVALLSEPEIRNTLKETFKPRGLWAAGKSRQLMHNWVLVKGVHLSYHNRDLELIILFPIMVPEIKSLNKKTGR